MRVDIITNEFPPDVYGGAGVHVTELAKALAPLCDAEIYCFGEDRNLPGVFAFQPSSEIKRANPAVQTLAIDLQIANALDSEADIFHSHTWYANFAGMLGGKLKGVPHILTAHSLEPLRPWKAEQLGGGYNVSSWVELEAYKSAAGIIAVSDAMRADIFKCYGDEIDGDKVTTILNGVVVEDFAVSQAPDEEVLAKYGVDRNLPTAIFVGRVTRQKGISYLLDALKIVDSKLQVILCAGQPDTDALAKEFAAKIAELKAVNSHVIYIPEKVSPPELNALLGASDCFLCPSIYEPLGIVNLEAMACHLPVVATRTGGIPEVVIDGETGFLVDIEQVNDGTGSPLDPAKYAKDFALAIDSMFSDPARAKQMGEAGFARAKSQFSWNLIAQQTLDFYKSVSSL